MKASATRLTAVAPAIALALWCGAGCVSAPPKYVRAELALTYPGTRDRPAQVITDEQWIAELISPLAPGVGRGHWSSMGVGAMASHRILLTRENGKIDEVTIYNEGVAWSEGRGDWLLDEAQREHLAQLLASRTADSDTLSK